MARAVGTEMQNLDSSLSVNLTNPDFWVRLIMEPDRVSIVENDSGCEGFLLEVKVTCL